ncbi:zinc-dependent metalloprotease [Nocardioides terrisoli]|uniref:zinc-dependent metalloprotease n=1 Tax=Nocardioides terrisoli TaxID=3388267 RepID=UPI00287B7308|nr:zinc-dependent metalloprotease [Nocardioides marmorisolisilvae]
MDNDTPPRMIDWDLAVRIGSRLAGDGPEVDAQEAADCVAELRAGAVQSTPLVREFTGLVAEEVTAPVLVVDRPGWIQANADAFETVIGPLLGKLTERKGAPSALATAIGSRVTGVELGAMFGFLAGKVLGQFDPFYSAGGAGGRLLLVAPNVVHVERELRVDPHDFRLWVCLHEETHRVQFTAVPWMRDHLQAEMGNIVGSIRTDPTEFLGELVKRVGDLVSGQRPSTGSGQAPSTGSGQGGSLIDLFASPEQKQVIERVTGVMSLLEGHADVVMDGVGPEVIPSVADIRRKFTQRRKGVGVLDRLLRRLLGLDQKMAQYRDGAVFVRAAIDKVGMDGFNAVWAGPENLPSKAEILDPDSWLRRVHG